MSPSRPFSPPLTPLDRRRPPLPSLRSIWNPIPVNSGLIASLSRPGGQVTGIFFDFPEFSKKWLQLLKEAIPKLSSIAVLWDPATGPVQIKGVEIAAEELKVKVEIMEVPGISNLDDSIFAASGKGVDAILMLSSAVIGGNAEYLAGLTLGLRLPAVTIFPEFARRGGLMAYGVNPLNLRSEEHTSEL